MPSWRISRVLASLRCCKPTKDELLAADERDLPRPTHTRDVRPCARTLAFISTLVFAACAVLLPIAWFVVVPFYIDTDSLSHKYAFEPMKISAFTGWCSALFAFVPLLTPLIIFGVFGDSKDCARLGVYTAGAVYLIMLLVGNLLSASRTDSRIAYRSDFAAKFNKYYCDSRTLRMCLDKANDRHRLVLLTRGNATASAAAPVSGVLGSETPTTAALAIWTRCKTVILEAMALETARDNEPEEANELEIETGKIYRFVDDSGASHAVDAWCGSLLTRAAPFTDAEHQALPSPFAHNVAMYESYTQEWARRMDYSNVLLGAAVGSMALAVASTTLHERLSKSA